MALINGIMLDPARLLESRATYRELIPLIADYGYNTIFWHFTDDQGCMLQFPSHPELASANAYSVKEMHDLIRLAEQHGIQIIPELECFGHAGYITSKKQYQHLCDGAGSAEFSAITPFHPDSQQILRDLIADCAEIFKSPYLHVGLDEVGFGDNPHSKKYLRKQEKWQAFAGHCNWLHDVVKHNGKQMLMWGDHLLDSTNRHGTLDISSLDKRITDLISKDIIICDWHYNDDVDNSSLAFFKSKGFRCIACPSSMAYGSLTHPRQYNLDNIQQFTQLAHKKSNTHVLGIMNTIWCPFRYFSGCTLYAIAYAGQQQAAATNASTTAIPKPAPDRQTFGEQFLQHTFGIKSKALATAFIDIHRYMPDLFAHHQMLAGKAQDLKDAAGTALAIEHSCAHALRKAITYVLEAAAKVKRNAQWYNDITCSLAIVDHMLERPTQLTALLANRHSAKQLRQRAPQAAKKQLREQVRLLQSLYRETSRLRKAAEQRWRKTRFWDDPKRCGKQKQYRYRDSLTQHLYQHEAFIKKLIQENQLLISGA